MRHRDDDLSPFREDPVVKALTAPATEAELAHEPDALAAFRGASPVPPQRRRSAARVATGTTVAVLTLAVSGGVAAAYTANLPDSWQQKVYKQFHSIGVPAPKHHTTSATTSAPPTIAAPAPSTVTTPSPSSTRAGTPKPTKTPTTEPSATTSPQPTSSLPVTVPTPAETAPTSPTTSPTASEAPAPAPGGQLQIRVSPGNRVSAGTQLTVAGKLTAPDGTPVAGRRVALVERVAGAPGRQRLATGVTAANGEVTITGPSAERNLRLVLRAGHHVRSEVQRIVVIPTLNIQVPSTPPGATAVTVTIMVSGGQAGDVVVVRGPGARDGRRATIDSSLRTTFTLPVSQTQSLHYRAIVHRTRVHAGHSLAFYVPASGG
ncbi:MAG TPA: hypothetical protein VHD81_05550 [Mycobacteriales bacterium]|nr:hypothetical protein [Mycobacteriales bacterium]